MENYKFSNGDRMPIIGIGTWQSDREKLFNAIIEAVKFGYRHIDCAYIYDNEDIVGEALEYLFKNDGLKREDIWITSKLWNAYHKKGCVLPAIERSLKNLRLDYLDLYLVHWPVALKEYVKFPEKPEDFYTLEEVPLFKTWEGMENVLMAGLTRHIGVSNFSVRKLEGLERTAKVKPEVNQVELNPYLQQPELQGYCRRNKICLTAYSPLGKGDTARQNDLNLFKDPVLNEIADKYKCPVSQVMLKWAIQKGIVVIPKSVTPERIKENFDSLNIELTDDDMMRISTIDKNNRISYGGVFIIEGSPYTYDSIWD
ncbi:MAG: aldo/keto reductase [Rikenellaceae bacterium]|nr:aldo/keto reductase [Rikenellaceae bacterium]